MFSIGLLCTVIKYEHCFQAQLCLQPLLSSSVLEVAPYLVHQHFRRTKLGGTGWGCYIWCFSCRNREPDLSNHMWNHPPLKNMYKNTKTKSLCDTYWKTFRELVRMTELHILLGQLSYIHRSNCRLHLSTCWTRSPAGIKQCELTYSIWQHGSYRNWPGLSVGCWRD